MGRLDSRVAIVTGGASGIGRAVVKLLAAEGAAVLVVDIDLDAGLQIAADVQRDGCKAIAVGADVSRATESRHAVETAIEAFGRVDVLVNNAGIVRYGTVENLTEADWDAVIGTNLKGTFLMSKFVIPLMRSVGGGTIVNVTSVQAFASNPLVPAYTASKGAISAMTRTMAIDHAGDGIRVVAVAPGATDTAMLRQAADLFEVDDPEGAVAAWGAAQPIGRTIRPEEVAALIAFLASDEASAISGSIHNVDGAVLARLAGAAGAPRS